MKKLFLLCLTLALTCGMALAKDNSSTPKAKKISGYVSDEKCGAKVNADCAKKCVEAGEPVVFVTDKDQQVLKVDNQDALKDHAGHHVQVTGTIDNGTLHVDSVKMLKQKEEKSKSST